MADKYPTKPTLIIDTREREDAWDFDDDDGFDKVVHKKLDEGDYSLEGFEHMISIEKKGSADELFMNFGKAANKKRVYREADRLKSYPHKFFVICRSVEELVAPASYYVNRLRSKKHSPFMPGAVVMENLVELMITHDIHIVFGGMKAQAVAKKILLTFYDNVKRGKIDVTSRD